MENKQFDSISKKLDVLIGLLTMNITEGKTLLERVELLKSLGLTQGEIAGALGKTTVNIKSALRDVRRKKKPKNSKGSE